MYEDLSATDEHILATLNYHVTQNDYVSITVLANECNVAKSTIVKLSKKLGYDGFSDLRDDLAQGGHDVVSDTYLPMSITDTEDVLDDATRMAERFWAHRGHNNVLISYPNFCSSLLSSYLARKLAMLGMPAIETYDYATIMSVRSLPGIVLFYEHNLTPRAERGRIFMSVPRPHFRLAQEMGYEVMLVSDEPTPTLAAQLAHDVFRVKPTREPQVDLFIPRVMMLFELMLSECSRIAAQDEPAAEPCPTVDLPGTSIPDDEELS